MLNQEAEPAAGSVINGADREGDEEVQQDAQGVSGGDFQYGRAPGSARTRMERLPAEQACGDYEWNAVTKEDQGLGEVESSGEQAACGDC